MTIKKLSALIGMAILATGCSTQPLSTTTAKPTIVTPPSTPATATNERERMLASLNLTDVQKSQLEALRLQNRPKMQALQAQLKQYDAMLAQTQTGTNEASLLNLYQQKYAITLQEAELHRQYEQRFLAILTPSQQIQYYQTLPENKKP